MIQGHEITIKKLLGPDYVFDIPGYQRPYSWTEEQAQELLDDLTDAATSSESGNDPEPYFLGSVVLIKPDRNEPHSEVIDGQQRITTLLLLLAALRTKIADAQHISELLFQNANQYARIESRCRLHLRKLDQPFFEQLLSCSGESAIPDQQKQSLPEPQQKLRKTYELFYDQIRSREQSACDDLFSYILLHVFLIVVTTPNLNSAFRIFSILNDRGLSLSAADILKSEIIARIPGEKRDQYTEKWEAIEENLGVTRFVELFSHIRTIETQSRMRTSVLDEIRKKVLPQHEPTHFIDHIVRPYADAYEMVLGNEYNKGHDPRRDWNRRAIYYITEFGDADALAPLISFFSTESSISGGRYFLENFERLVVYLWLSETPRQKRISRFCKVIAELKTNSNRILNGSPLQLTSDETEEMREHLLGPILERTPPRKVRSLIVKLDEELGGKGPRHDGRQIVEQVLPDAVPENSQWTEWWSDPQKRRDSHALLGNAVLLTRKRAKKWQQEDFQQKKANYFLDGQRSSPFAITTRACKKRRWGPRELAEAQRTSVSALYKAWDLH